MWDVHIRDEFRGQNNGCYKMYLLSVNVFVVLCQGIVG